MVRLNDDTFEGKIKESGILLIKLEAEWCGPCKAMVPVLADVSERYEDEVEFCTIDVDRAPAAAQSLNVTGVPTLILFKDGKQINRLVGAQTKTKIETVLKNAID